MHRVQLIHWNAAESEQRAETLRDAGYEVLLAMASGPAFLRALRSDPPAAVVIDLSRIPSQGRDMAVSIRAQKATRHVPLVFLEGDPKKVARIRELLPDAVYSSWSQIPGALEQAIAHPPADPIVPESVFAAYAGRPLAQKLGIKPDTVVALEGAPQGFAVTLGDLPDGVKLQEGACEPCDLIIWFVRSRDELDSGIAGMAALGDQRPIWIAWPKQASKLAPDLSQQVVRETGLATGLVDYKICSIDATWSGLLFTRRRPK